MEKIDRFAGEGALCTCASEAAHDIMVTGINASYIKDAQRRREAPTTQTIRAKALAQKNGHA